MLLDDPLPVDMINYRNGNVRGRGTDYEVVYLFFKTDH